MFVRLMRPKGARAHRREDAAKITFDISGWRQGQHVKPSSQRSRLVTQTQMRFGGGYRRLILAFTLTVGIVHRFHHCVDDAAIFK